MRAGIRTRAALGLALITAVATARSSRQIPAVLTLDENALREYAGVYQWDSNAFTYLQLWNEFGTNQLVAFDESGEVVRRSRRRCGRRVRVSEDPRRHRQANSPTTSSRTRTERRGRPR